MTMATHDNNRGRLTALVLLVVALVVLLDGAIAAAASDDGPPTPPTSTQGPMPTNQLPVPTPDGPPPTTGCVPGQIGCTSPTPCAGEDCIPQPTTAPPDSDVPEHQEDAPVEDPDCGMTDLTGCVAAGVNSVFRGLAEAALSPILELLAATALSTPTIDQLPGIGELWQNSFEMVVAVYGLLILIGGIVVMSHESVQTRYSVKEIGPRIVIAFLASTLSLFFADKLIRLANAFSAAILGDGVNPPALGNTLSEATNGAFTGGLFLILTVLVLVVVGLGLLIVYVVRVMLTVLLVITGPVFLMFHALPHTDGLARWWWRATTIVVTIQIGQSFVLIVAVKTLLSGGIHLFSSFGALGTIIGAIGLFYVLFKLRLSQGDLDRGDKLASIVSMSVAIFTLPLSVVAIVVTMRQGSQAAAGQLSLVERLDTMAEMLAAAVRTQWETEEQIRRIHDPFPLPIRWTAAPDHVMDHWSAINGAIDRPEPVTLAGHGDDIVDTFRSIPSGRLVVLGRAGAGKTVLTSRFVLNLLANRSIPVPVIFTLGSWNPTTSQLRDWLAEQLTTTYPMLAERDSAGTTIAAQLLATRRILPVLDGFDERHRAAAIVTINAGLRRDDQLLLTSRLDEYEAAVQASDVLTAAAVVRLEDVTLDDAASYLPLTTRRTDARSGRNKWETVLTGTRTAALADAFSTPLMLALARTIFSDKDADPAELLDVSSADALEERLLANFVPAVYAGTPHQADAHRWFGFLATHLRRVGTYELAWWQLALSVPRAALGLIAGAILTAATWLVTGFPAAVGTLPEDVRWAWFSASLVWGSLVGLSGGMLIGYFRDIRPTPAKKRPAIRGRLRQITHDVTHDLLNRRSVYWIGAWVVGGVLFGLVAGVASRSATGVVFGVTGSIVIGAITWLAGSAIRASSSSVEPTEVVSPNELIRTDRATAIREGITFGVFVSIVFWPTIWITFEAATTLSPAQAFGPAVWMTHSVLLVAGATMIWILLVTVSGSWLIARVWLPLSGKLPWQVTAFLADAHRRGVLRQTGGVYQFRHARLQDHLANTHLKNGN